MNENRLVEQAIRLSIIVPIFNVEKYLEQCVMSLLHQDIPKEDYEIILVNDGSTDSSYDIAQRLSGENDHIVLQTQENQGQSVARNKGIEIARGRYIMFVDSDDYIKENSLGRILAVSESEHLDICIYKCLAKWADGTFHDDMGQPFEKNKVFSGEQLMLDGYRLSAVWNSLYRTDLLIGNNIRFYPGILHQDVEFNHRIYPLAKRVMLTDVVCYYYCIYGDSSSRGTNPMKINRIILSDIDVAVQLLKASKSSVYSRPIRNLLSKRSRSIMVSNLLGLIRERKISREEKLSCLEYAKSRSVYPCYGLTSSFKSTLFSFLLYVEPLYRKLL